MNASLRYSMGILLGWLLSLSLFACGGETTAESVSLVKCRLNSDCPNPDTFKCIDGECIEQFSGEEGTDGGTETNSPDAGNVEIPDAGNDPIVGCNPGCDNGYECDVEAHRCICTNSRIECNVGGVMKCMDMYENEEHCGECNNRCADKGAGLICKSGECVCPNENEGVCPNGSCISIIDDQQNCGACQNVCGLGKTCEGTACVCQTDAPTDCGDYCADTQNDTDNCGQCGFMCAWGQDCVNGECKCPGNEKLCSNTCVDFKTDEDNCGKCGNKCRDDQTCLNGVCQCTSGSECNGECISLTTSTNCGACGNFCTSSQRCNATTRSCECDASRDYILCNGKCVNEKTDFYNCGGCGKKCLNGGYCSNKTCQNNCATGQQLCKGMCMDFAANHIEYCSDNGIVSCAWAYLPNTGAASMLASNWADVDGNVSNGCEENTVYNYRFTFPAAPTDYANGVCMNDNALPLNTGATYTIVTDTANKRFIIKNCNNQAVGYITPNPQSSPHWQATEFRFVDNFVGIDNLPSSASVTYNKSSRTFTVTKDGYVYLVPYSTYYEHSYNCYWKINAKSTKVSDVTIQLDPAVHPTGTTYAHSLRMTDIGNNKYMHINSYWTGSMAKLKLNYTTSVPNGAAACSQPSVTWTSSKPGYVTISSDGRINLINRTNRTVVKAMITAKVGDQEEQLELDISPFPLVQPTTRPNAAYPYVSRNEVSEAAFIDFLTERGVACNGIYGGNDLVDTYNKLSCSNSKWSGDMAKYQNPITNISWYGAAEYATWMGGKLPTDSEWKILACGETIADCTYPALTMDASNIGKYAWTSISGQYGESKPTEAQKSAQKLGTRKMYDLIGNLWEFVAPTSGNLGWRKGCGFKTTNVNYCSVQYTEKEYSKTKIFNDNGFRVLLKEQH